MTASEIEELLTAAEIATGQGPEKWAKNSDLISWFRHDPMAVLRVIQSAIRVRSHHGGLAHSQLYEALDALPGLQKEAA